MIQPQIQYAINKSSTFGKGEMFENDMFSKNSSTSNHIENREITKNQLKIMRNACSLAKEGMRLKAILSNKFSE